MKKSKSKKPTPAVIPKKTGSKQVVVKPLLNESAVKYITYCCLAILLLFVIIVRSRLLGFPLERDEGEYALMGQLILKGIPPYEMAYNMKLPGTYYMYALIMSIFGQTTIGIHIGLMLVNIASIIIIFFLGKRLVNTHVGLLSAASFAILSLSPGVVGFVAHATHFIVLFSLAGLLSLLKYQEKQKLYFLALSGFCCGLAFIMKQQAIFFLVFGPVVYWMIEKKREPFNIKSSLFRFLLFGGMLVLPYLIVVLSTWFTGTFDKFWHWTFEYAQQYVTNKTNKDPLINLKDEFPYVSEGFRMFWIIGLLGLGLLFFSKGAKAHRWDILLFTITSIACVVPGLYFRSHYFIAFLPALALLVAIAFNFFNEQLSKLNMPWLGMLPYLFFGFIFYHGISTHKNAFFKDDLGDLSFKSYGPANPFRESIEVAKFVEANSTEEDKIAVLGSEPQICFYSDRLPATGYIYTYALMENQPYSENMQMDMISEIESNKPKIFIYVNSPVSWLVKENSNKYIFDWYRQYMENYNLAGLIELNPTGEATYTWRDALAGYEYKSNSQIWIYERK